MKRSRILIGVPLFCLALLGLSLLFRSRGDQRQQHFPIFEVPASNSSSPQSGAGPISTQNVSLTTFWGSVSKALLQAKPPCSIPDEEVKASVNKFANIKKGSNKRPDLTKLSQKDVDSLRDVHSGFVAQIPYLAAQLPYKKGTRGIVTTAANEFLPTLIVSLRMLRRTGSKLPVQVLVESWDYYEKKACEEVLPALNATCFVVSDVLDKVPGHVQISVARFQLKAFAMLFSPFDEILLLDADSITVERPEQWMDAEPFISTGFVGWPDYVRLAPP